MLWEKQEVQHGFFGGFFLAIAKIKSMMNEQLAGLFAVHPWMYRQLSMDYFDTEEHLKTWEFSGKFWS